MRTDRDLVKIVDANTLKRFKDLGDYTRFNFATDLFYEGQTPLVAYLIISGSIQLLKNKKIKKTFGPNTIIGIRELMHREKVDYCARVVANSELFLVSKSDILEVIDGNDELADKIGLLLAANA